VINNNDDDVNNNKTTEHVVAQCSSLSESTNHGRHKVAKIIHQQTATKNKLLDKNIPQYYRYKRESALESATKIFLLEQVYHNRQNSRFQQTSHNAHSETE